MYNKHATYVMKSIFMSLLLLFSVPFASFSLTEAAPQEQANGVLRWVTETVDNSLTTSPSIATDSSGNPHLLYVTANGLVHAYRSAGGWVKEFADSPANYEEEMANHVKTYGPGYGGELSSIRSFYYPTIKLDSTGAPHITYDVTIRWFSDRGGSTTRVMYASESANKWTRTILASGSNWGGGVEVYDPNLAVDGLNKPHTTYYWSEESHSRMSYAAMSGGALSNEEISNLVINPARSLVADASGSPHLCYQKYNGSRYEWTPAGLGYMVKSGDSWNTEAVDPTAKVGACSIALDGSGNPQISYYDANNRSWKYAVKPGTSWKIETVTSEAVSGGLLAVDSSGNPHILYQDPVRNKLKIAAKSGEAWIFETANTNLDAVWGPAFTVDADGNPHITYIDATSGFLRYLSKTAAGKPETTISSSYNLTFEGYNYDEKNEAYILVNNEIVTALPQSNTPFMSFKYAYYTLDISKYVVTGANTVTFKQNNGSSEVRNLKINGPNGEIFSDNNSYQLLVRPCEQGIVYRDGAYVSTLICYRQSTTYNFTLLTAGNITTRTTNTPPSGPTYTLSFQGYDYDNPAEASILVNSQAVATLPTSYSPQNNNKFADYSLNITKYVLPGANTITFKQNIYSSGAKNVQITSIDGATIYSNSTYYYIQTEVNGSITYKFNAPNNSAPS